jgi:alpha-L-arabinofuranosidase
MMRIVHIVLIALLSLYAFTKTLAQITVNQSIPATATIQVDASRTAGNAIPRTIFGSFLEPIGNSTYNGLWAEILQNPSLEAGLWSAGNVSRMLREEPALTRASELDLPVPWEPLDPNQGNRYELRYGNAANSWRSVVIMGVPGQPTGIRQKVYLPIHRTLEYKGSLYARHLSGPTVLVVCIRQRNGSETLASAHINAVSDSWTKYTFDLHLTDGKLHRLDPADFVVQVEDDERVEVDQLSLMPDDALDGLDPDEVAMAKAMETPLVRFGGNFTSGYHWRDGIGPRDKRISMQNGSWGIPEYNTFGTDEFLHFCNLIGADPQVALNLGSGTPEEAGDWVRYVNDHWHKHGGLTWELGNELWGNWNIGYPTLEELAAFALPIGLEEKLKEMQQQINSAPAFAEKTHIAFTEWLFIGNRPGTPSFRNMGGAIDAAGFFNMLMRNSAIVPISDMTGIMEFGGIWKARSQVFAAPGYYAFRMYSTAHATRLVSVEAQSGSYSVQHGVGRIPDVSNVPYLDVVAALNDQGDALTLFCVNRSLDTDIPATIKVAGFRAAETAEVQTLHGSGISDGNDEDNPEQVVPEKIGSRMAQNSLEHVFPRESVTRIVFKRSQ